MLTYSELTELFPGGTLYKSYALVGRVNLKRKFQEYLYNIPRTTSDVATYTKAACIKGVDNYKPLRVVWNVPLENFDLEMEYTDV